MEGIWDFGEVRIAVDVGGEQHGAALVELPLGQEARIIEVDRLARLVHALDLEDLRHALRGLRLHRAVVSEERRVAHGDALHRRHHVLDVEGDLAAGVAVGARSDAHGARFGLGGRVPDLELVAQLGVGSAVEKQQRRLPLRGRLAAHDADALLERGRVHEVGRRVRLRHQEDVARIGQRERRAERERELRVIAFVVRPRRIAVGAHMVVRRRADERLREHVDRQADGVGHVAVLVLHAEEAVREAGVEDEVCGERVVRPARHADIERLGVHRRPDAGERVLQRVAAGKLADGIVHVERHLELLARRHVVVDRVRGRIRDLGLRGQDVERAGDDSAGEVRDCGGVRDRSLDGYSLRGGGRVVARALHVGIDESGLGTCANRRGRACAVGVARSQGREADEIVGIGGRVDHLRRHGHIKVARVAGDALEFHGNGHDLGGRAGHGRPVRGAAGLHHDRRRFRLADENRLRDEVRYHHAGAEDVGRRGREKDGRGLASSPGRVDAAGNLLDLAVRRRDRDVDDLARHAAAKVVLDAVLHVGDGLVLRPGVERHGVVRGHGAGDRERGRALRVAVVHVGRRAVCGDPAPDVVAELVVVEVDRADIDAGLGQVAILHELRVVVRRERHVRGNGSLRLARQLEVAGVRRGLLVVDAPVGAVLHAVGGRLVVGCGLHGRAFGARGERQQAEVARLRRVGADEVREVVVHHFVSAGDVRYRSKALDIGPLVAPAHPHAHLWRIERRCRSGLVRAARADVLEVPAVVPRGGRRCAAMGSVVRLRIPVEEAELELDLLARSDGIVGHRKRFGAVVAT